MTDTETVKKIGVVELKLDQKAELRVGLHLLDELRGGDSLNVAVVRTHDTEKVELLILGDGTADIASYLRVREQEIRQVFVKFGFTVISMTANTNTTGFEMVK